MIAWVDPNGCLMLHGKKKNGFKFAKYQEIFFPNHHILIISYGS
jgi:hypothetical protein